MSNTWNGRNSFVAPCVVLVIYFLRLILGSICHLLSWWLLAWSVNQCFRAKHPHIVCLHSPLRDQVQSPVRHLDWLAVAIEDRPAPSSWRPHSCHQLWQSLLLCAMWLCCFQIDSPQIIKAGDDLRFNTHSSFGMLKSFFLRGKNQL